jgi:phosphoserine phosphatase
VSIRRLHIFDMDGTLLPGTTAGLELSRSWGTGEGFSALESAFAAGVLTPVGFAHGALELWKGMQEQHIRTAFDASPKLPGIRAVLADIRRRGEMSAVVTLSPDFFARLFRSFGAHLVVASRFPPPPFDAPLAETGILTSAKKLDAVDVLRRRLRISWRKVVAYGDGPTDLPLFERSGFAVAIGTNPVAMAAADLVHPGADLRAAYHLGRRAMTRPTLTRRRR